MTRRIHLQLAAIVSNDGTRCASECPHRDPGYGHCTAFDKPLVFDLGHGAYDRCPTCIAAEQAAAPLVCTCATMRRDPDMPGYQMCTRCTIAHDAIVDEWTRIGSLEDAVMREIAAVGGPVVRDVGGPINVAASVAATIARLGVSPPGDHLDGGARALDASEALARARRDGIRAGYRIARRRDTPADEDAALAEMHEETAFASEYVSRAVAAIEARCAEALREARVQGMREALAAMRTILKEDVWGTPYIDLDDAEEALDAAIEAVRKGER